jgi:hypothetical protein
MEDPVAECECGRSVPVPADARSTLLCPCGNRVVVPLPEEFRCRSHVLSAMTVERRVRRLLAAGDIPPQGVCALCGQAGEAEEVDLRLICERSHYQSSGGRRFLFIPFINLFMWWEEERRVEVLGHDTAVPVPLALCQECARSLPCPQGDRGDLAAAAAILAVAAAVCYFSVLAGIAVGVTGLAAVSRLGQRREARWQGGLKALVGQVPAYRQLLDQYRFATVVVPRGVNSGSRTAS